MVRQQEFSFIFFICINQWSSVDKDCFLGFTSGLLFYKQETFQVRGQNKFSTQRSIN